MPDLEPESHVPEPPEEELPVTSIIESAGTFLSPKPGEAASESEFAEKFKEAIKKANPGNETLDAMEGK